MSFSEDTGDQVKVDFLEKYKTSALMGLLGLILVGMGLFIYRNTDVFEKDRIEIIKPEESQNSASEIIVEIAGSVEKPGVFTLKNGSRIDELLIVSGGLSADADRDWVQRYVNRAARLTDGQKLYIRSVGEQSESVSARNVDLYQTASSVLGSEDQGLVNINTATFSELDDLPGIGRVYGQKIIEQRPYSTSEELLTRQILPKSTFEKIKEKITVY